MAFSRVNSGGWATNAKFTSTQCNQLDIDHANALDKSVAGDTLNGIVQIAATGGIECTTPGGGIGSFIPGGIIAETSASIISNTVGGIALCGGSTDYPTYSVVSGSTVIPASRSFSRVVPLMVNTVFSGWTASLSGPGFTAAGTFQIFTLPTLWNGATLSSVSVAFIVESSHSGVPANLPSISVSRYALTGSPGASVSALSTTSVQSFSPAPGSGAAWYNSGAYQALTYTANQNNVINSTLYQYVIGITDEYGANSIAGNYYVAATLNYTAVANMAPQ